MTERKLAREHPALDHDGAMDLIHRAGTVTLVSYEEAIAVYLRARHILVDDAKYFGAPIPAEWNPGRPTTETENIFAAMWSAVERMDGHDLDQLAKRLKTSRTPRRGPLREPDDLFRQRLASLLAAAIRGELPGVWAEGGLRSPPPPATLEEGPEYHRRNPHYATGADLDAIAENVGERRPWSEPDEEFRPRVVTAWTARPPIPRTPGASLIEALSQRIGAELSASVGDPGGFRGVCIRFRDAEMARRFMALLRVGAPEREG